MQVLVVDDNKDAADTFAMVLAVHGFDVRVAYDGPSALAIAAESPPDIAVLDLGLPTISGYEIGRQLRSRLGSDIQIIALSGWGRDEDLAKSREAGFDFHFTKPAGAEMIVELLTRSRRPPPSSSPAHRP